MRSTLTRLLAATVLAALASLALLSPTAGAATTPMIATTTLNVRSGPSTSAPIVGGLYRGQTVAAISTANGWTSFSFKGKTAYAASKYLAKGAALPTTDKVGAGAVKTTTTAVNLRNGPSLTNKVLTILNQGTKVTATGTTAKGWTQVTAAKTTGWISSQYLTATATGLPTIIGTRVTTADLDVRVSSATGAKAVATIKKGTKVSITGATANGQAQIIYAGAVAWVTAKYLANATTTQPTPPALPAITGTRYATAPLTIRSTSASTYTTIGEIPKGTKISITGVVQNGRMQIIWNGAARWVTAKYLSVTKPSTSSSSTSAVEKGLKPNAILTLHAVLAKFPQIKTVYGVRKDPLPDHPSGRALDFMLPSYKSAAGKALGYSLSRWVQANHTSLGINYIIYDQHIWNVNRSSEGWRYMASRGSDTANHKDHVHVTVFAAGLPAI